MNLQRQKIILELLIKIIKGTPLNLSQRYGENLDGLLDVSDLEEAERQLNNIKIEIWSEQARASGEQGE